MTFFSAVSVISWSTLLCFVHSTYFIVYVISCPSPQSSSNSALLWFFYSSSSLLLGTGYVLLSLTLPYFFSFTRYLFYCLSRVMFFSSVTLFLLFSLSSLLFRTNYALRVLGIALLCFVQPATSFIVWAGSCYSVLLPCFFYSLRLPDCKGRDLFFFFPFVYQLSLTLFRLRSI